MEANRRYIGIELMEQYAELARKRVQQMMSAPKLDWKRDFLSSPYSVSSPLPSGSCMKTI